MASDSTVLFTAKVVAFTITEDQSTTDQECSRVIVQRRENGEHQIIVFNHTTDREVFSCYIHGNMQLIHSEESILKWTAGTDSVSTYNLKFEDVTKIENLLSTVNGLLKNTSAIYQPNSSANQLISENVVAKEEKVNRSVHSAMAVKKLSHNVGLLTTQTKENTTHLAVQKSMVFEENITQFNIPEADAGVETESENVTTHSELDVTGDDLPDTSAQEESSKITAASGNEVVNAIKGSEQQCSETDSESIAPMTSTPSNCAVDLPTKLNLSIRSQEKSYTTSGEAMSKGAVVVGPGTGTTPRPAGEEMQLERDIREVYLEEMMECYLETAGKSLLQEREKGSKKCHRCISALICCQGKIPHVAVLCTGTHYNDNEVCYSTEHIEGKVLSNSPCDGHAEALCFEAAPIYFQREMLKCLDEKEKQKQSVFVLENKQFKLKGDVTFHLLVTEPPCGWIRNKQQPRMQWKTTFKKAPHIPKCSSKILICSRMGIQGYVSHLLEDCIFIKSVIILCADRKVKEGPLEYNVDPKFSLPHISVMHYDPNMFNPNIITFKPMYLMKAENEFPSATDNTDQEIAHNDTHGLNGTDDESGHKKSSLATGRSDRSQFLNYTFNPCEKDEKKREHDYAKTRKKEFSVVERKVDRRLLDEVNSNFQVERKEKLKKMYDDLSDLLMVADELKGLLKELKESEFNYCKKIYKKACGKQKQLGIDQTLKPEVGPLSIAEDIEIKTQQLLRKNFKSSKVWDKEIKNFIKKINAFQTEGTKLIDYQNMIEDIEKILEEKLDIVIDCAWQRYFYNESTGIQATAATI